MSKIERRLFTTELRVEQDSEKPPVIRGHAAVFNKLSENLGGFRERIKPGAFSKTLKSKPDVRALFNHDPNYILGRTKSGTLKVVEDENGLRYDIDPPDTTVARDLMESLKRGDIDQSSFAFRVITDDWHNEDGELIRELIEVDIDGGDVSPVTYPAYPQTSAQMRALYFPNGLPDEVERALSESKEQKPDPVAEELKRLQVELQAVTEERNSLRSDNASVTEKLDAAIAECEQLRTAASKSETETIERLERMKAPLEEIAESLESLSVIEPQADVEFKGVADALESLRVRVAESVSARASEVAGMARMKDELAKATEIINEVALNLARRSRAESGVSFDGDFHAVQEHLKSAAEANSNATATQRGHFEALKDSVSKAAKGVRSVSRDIARRLLVKA